MISFDITRSDLDLLDILALQKANLSSLISPEEASKEGFVTVEHNFELLKKMNSPYPHIVARDGQNIVAYALVMLKEIQTDIPILKPLFEVINQISYDGKVLEDCPFFVMGQVCIDKLYRGRGLFQGMYEEMRNRMKSDFDYIITEISALNQRSLRAHLRVGFEIVHEHTGEDREKWHTVLWDISSE